MPHKEQSIITPCAIVFAVAFLASLNTIFNGFVFDDTDYFTNNRVFTDYRNLLLILTSSDYPMDALTDVSNYYRPLPNIYYMAVHYTLGLKPPGMHAFNVVVHSLNSLLVFFVASELLRPVAGDGDLDEKRARGALLAGILFAVHPVHAEAVAWVSAISELMLAFFFLASMLLYLRGRYAAGALTYFLALLCKEPAVTLLFVLVAHDLFIGKRAGLKEAVKRYVPYAVASVVYLALRLNALDGAMRQLDAEVGLMDSIPSIPPLLALYVKKLVLPLRLSPYAHFDPYYAFADLNFMLALAGAFISAATLYLLYKKRRPLPALFASLIVIPLLPALYIPGLVMNMSVYADRYLYLPSVGFVMLLANSTRGGRIGNIAASALLVVAALYSIQTVRTNATWRGEDTLIKAAYEMMPDDYQVAYTLSSRAHIEKRLDEAAGQLKRAIELNEGSGMPNLKFIKISRTALAELYRKTGNLNAALDEASVVLKLDPAYADAHYNMAVTYGDAGAYDLAVQSYGLALKHSTVPADRKNILNNLGNAYVYLGRYDEAVESYKGALTIKPDDRMALRNMSVAIGRKRAASER
jgi:tetratricopeptide (TPR) repeat protein